MADLHPGCYSHRVMRTTTTIKSLGRNDRIYTSYSIVDIQDSAISGGAAHPAEDDHICSDHVPVLASLGKARRSPPRYSVIPSWVAKHPEFGPLALDLYEGFEHCSPFTVSSSTSLSSSSTGQGRFSGNSSSVG